MKGSVPWHNSCELSKACCWGRLRGPPLIDLINFWTLENYVRADHGSVSQRWSGSRWGSGRVPEASACAMTHAVGILVV